MQVEIKPAAQRDLDEILAYSQNSYGEDTADKYLSTFHACLERLRGYPESGPRKLGLGRLTRRLSFMKHTIYYEVGPAQVTILRVLHQAMNPKGRV